MTTQSEFIPKALDKLWRAGDSSLEAAMSDIIAEANSALRRVVVIPANSTEANFTVTSRTADAELASDRQAIARVRADVDSKQTYFTFLSPPQFGKLIGAENYDDCVYTIIDNTLQVNVTDDTTVYVLYNGSIDPVFESGSDTGFYGRHPDFYMNKVCEKASEWMRDGESAAYFAQLCAAAQEEVIAYERMLLYGDGGITMPVPGTVV